jgi:hypothetical protein
MTTDKHDSTDTALGKTKSRLKETHEFFTPMYVVNDMIDELERVGDKDGKLCILENTLDPAAGNGAFMYGVLKRKEKRGQSKSDALTTTFATDLMLDNVMDCTARAIFWELGTDDIFDGEHGQPSEGLEIHTTIGGKEVELYGDTSLYSIRKNNVTTFQREYSFQGKKIIVRQQPEAWWLVEYKTPSMVKFDSTKLAKNIMIQDFLKFDKTFDGTEPLYASQVSKELKTADATGTFVPDSTDVKVEKQQKVTTEPDFEW